MFSGVGSVKTAQEDKHHGALLPQRRQCYFPAIIGNRFKFRCGRAGGEGGQHNDDGCQ
jgi:hypothetical protein